MKKNEYIYIYINSVFNNFLCEFELSTLNVIKIKSRDELE